MKDLAKFFIAFGIFYLLYSIMFRDKQTIFFKNIKIVKGKKENYFKLQLYFSILNSIIIIGVSIISVIYTLDVIYTLYIPLFIYLVNYMMKKISKRKGYIEF